MEGQRETGMKRKVLGGRSAKPQGGASRPDLAAVIGRERGRWPAAGGMVRYWYWYESIPAQLLFMPVYASLCHTLFLLLLLSSWLIMICKIVSISITRYVLTPPYMMDLSGHHHTAEQKCMHILYLHPGSLSYSISYIIFLYGVS